MKPPILVIGDDVDLFSSVKAAEQYLEPPEVPHIVCFDVEGNRLKPVIARRLLTEVVRLVYDTSSTRDIPEVRNGLIRLVMANEGVAADSLLDLPLDELVRKASAYCTR